MQRTMTMLALAFWILILLGMYPFVLYPLLVALAGRMFHRTVNARPIEPQVSVVIAAHNEAACIERTVLNKLEQQYAAQCLEVIVISDGSMDGTDEILARLAQSQPRLRWRRQEPRAGKSAALNTAIELATGEIVVFADANSMYEPNAVARIVRNFADPEVGYVTGKMIYRGRDGSMVGDGCSAYMRFENWLRLQETRVGSIVGVDGGIDAIRRSLFQTLRADQLPDFVTPLRVVARGHRVVYEPEAVLEEDSLDDGAAEFGMRVRVALRALWAIRDSSALLSLRRHPMFAWQLWSHKLLRYLAFLPLLLAFALLLPLAITTPGYRLLLAAAIAMLLLGAIGQWFSETSIGGRVLRLLRYFVLLNAASAIAVLRYLRGERITLWKPRTG